MTRRRLLISPLVCSLAAAVFFMNAPPAVARHIQFGDLQYYLDIADPQISPDGKSIVLVVARPDYRNDAWEASLVLVDIASRNQRRLSNGAALKDVNFPRWSPSGDRLAFLAGLGSGDQETFQLFVMRMSDGRATQVTHAANDVSQFAWRPDGRAIAYVTADAAKHAPFDDAFAVGSDAYLTRAAATPSHIWLTSLDGRRQRRLTSGTAGLPSISPTYATVGSQLAWAPDGRSIAFARLPGAYEDGADRQEIRILDVATGAQRKLAQGRYQMMPLYSPDGARLAFAYPREGDYNQITQLFVAPAQGGTATLLTADLDRNVLWAAWMPGGSSLLLGADDRTRTSLWIQTVGGAARKLELGNVSWELTNNAEGDNWIPASVSRRGAIAFTGSEARHPYELYYMATPQSPPERLTDFNRQIAALDLAASHAFDWTGPNGFAEDGVVTYPPDYVSGKRYPLVVYIHGGPIASSATVFDELTQLLAARGYIVFRPNYRGSDNLGNAYERAIYRDAGDGPGRDVMAGVAALESTGVVDPNRVAVCGWSYGGFMTSWLIGHYHIWKAAVSGAAVNDWIVDYTTADDQAADRLQLGATPWSAQGYKAYIEQSPLTYAAHITTPTLIMGDTYDVRVPITQSYELFHALRDEGVPVKFVVYPVDGHLPADPVRYFDIDRRWVGWLSDYLK